MITGEFLSAEAHVVDQEEQHRGPEQGAHRLKDGMHLKDGTMGLESTPPISYICICISIYVYICNGYIMILVCIYIYIYTCVCMCVLCRHAYTLRIHEYTMCILVLSTYNSIYKFSI